MFACNNGMTPTKTNFPKVLRSRRHAVQSRRSVLKQPVYTFEYYLRRTQTYCNSKGRRYNEKCFEAKNPQISRVATFIPFTIAKSLQIDS